jgi:hypothetical protein
LTGERKNGQYVFYMDTALLTNVIVELNISRKKVLSYPKGHPYIEAAIDKAFDMLEKFLHLNNEITIGVAKDALMVGEKYLERENRVIKEFALALYRKGIASVTIRNSVTREDFVSFHDLISSEHKPDETFEEIINTARKTEMKNISVEVLDFRAFHLTKKERLDSRQKADFLWDTFIRAFLEETLDIVDHDENEGELELLDISPASLAEELNQKGTEEVPQAVCDKSIAN